MSPSAVGDTPVTVAITRTVRPGKEDRFHEVFEQMTETAASYPGHLGAGHIRAAHPGGEHVIVYRFDSPEHLDAWQDSDDRRRMLHKLDGVIEGEEREERSTGIEFWFADPTCAVAAPPKRWKQALVTWIGLFPTVFVLGLLLGWLWDPLPDLVRIMISTAVTVTLMTVAVMPTLTRLFRGFLRPGATPARPR
jgi:antibiotic biosynthesis monooxygenase (ABM) superfamily enzyme